MERDPFQATHMLKTCEIHKFKLNKSNETQFSAFCSQRYSPHSMGQTRNVSASATTSSGFCPREWLKREPVTQF